MLKKTSETIEAFRRGEFVIVMDDYERENEGDLICCAQTMTEKQMSFMLNHTTGIVCVAMEAERLCELQLPIMVKNNTDRNKTAFTVSVDLRNGMNLSTGVSAHDRTSTVRALANTSTMSHQDFSRPGHIFPLCYKQGGLFVRRGHTEAGVDLCRLANVYPAAVLCELQNEDGSMSRLKECRDLSEKYQIPIISIQDIVDYMKIHLPHIPCAPVEHICKVSETMMHLNRQDVDLGPVNMRIYKSISTGIEHIAIIKGDPSCIDQECLVRVHSECITGDLFGSLYCDCGQQLSETYALLTKFSNGVIIYMRDHEGRGIGLSEKIKAYELQAKGYDTIEANKALGYENDYRSYTVAAEILKDLKVSQGVLLTNNPDKLNALKPFIRRVASLQVVPNKYNKRYIKTKQDNGHVILSRL